MDRIGLSSEVLAQIGWDSSSRMDPQSTTTITTGSNSSSRTTTSPAATADHDTTAAAATAGPDDTAEFTATTTSTSRLAMVDALDGDERALVALPQGSDSDSEIMMELDQRRRDRKAREVEVAAMMCGRLQQLERNRHRDEERDELQKRYDEFVQDAEQRNGGEQHCDGHLKVFCGYMRLSSEDEEKARYRSQVDLGHLLVGRVCMHVKIWTGIRFSSLASNPIRACCFFFQFQYPHLFKECSCSYRTMDPNCKLRKVCKADWDLLAIDIANTKAGLYD